jgi:hypothetical protein
MEIRILHKLLSIDPMKSIVGMPLGHVEGFFLNVDLSSDAITARLTGAAFDLPDRTEAFLLSAAADIGKGWLAREGSAGWEPVDLLTNWQASGLEKLWSNPREVRYFYDSEDRDRGLPPSELLGSAAAIMLSADSSGSGPQVVLYATPEYPCALELATAPQRCEVILAGLTEFVPTFQRDSTIA